MNLYIFEGVYCYALIVLVKIVPRTYLDTWILVVSYDSMVTDRYLTPAKELEV